MSQLLRTHFRFAMLLAGALAIITVVVPAAPVSGGDATWNPGIGAGYWLAGDEERNIEKYAVSQVQPPYPPLAQKYKIEGIVTIQVAVDGKGKVAKAEFVRGHTIFRSVSLDAAKLWEFRLPDGSGLVGTIRFTFKLRG